MNPVITFKTALFDTQKEAENPYNPIPGSSVLVWLKDEVLDPDYRCTEPAAEDWGWYIDVSAGDRTWMVGAIAYADSETQPGDSIDWLIQFDKNRSFKEKLLGQAKLTRDEPLLQAVFRALENEPSFADVTWSET